MKKSILIGCLVGLLSIWASYSLLAQLKALDQIPRIIEQGMKAKAFPGCQVLILKNGKVLFEQSFGTTTYESAQKVDSNTIYDLASLTKTTGTLLAVMKLYDEQKLRLTDSLAQFLPFLRNTDKGQLSIQDLLFHESGLPASLSSFDLILERKPKDAVLNDSLYPFQPNNPTYRYKAGWLSPIASNEYALPVSDKMYASYRLKDTALTKIATIKLHRKQYLYSCINFILLKEVVESVSKCAIDRFLDSLFFKPMGLTSISYLPLRKYNLDRIAPSLKSDFLRNGSIQGYVHDPDAAFLGGVAGNAGLFATARDVAKIHQLYLNKGMLNGHRFLSAETCTLFTSTKSKISRRGLGFDKPNTTTPSNSPCCIDAPAQVYGHTGYTGTCCWVDPINQVIYVFLSNRTYPNDGINKLAKMGIRTQIQELIYKSLQ